MNTVLCIALLLGANVYTETFDGANQAYDSGNYQAAIDAYEQLIDENIENPAVFHNLGNAYYRNGRIGPAIANYERALQLDPGLDYAQENLGKCIRETKRQLARPLPPDWEQSLLFWHYSLTPRSTRWLALALWWTLWALLVLQKVRPVRYLTRAALLTGVLAVAFGVSAWVKSHGDLYAVANEPSVPVHYGTSDTETVRFELYEGDRVLVDRRERGWARIMTADGERGWAKEDALTLVGPPYERPAASPPPAEDAGKSPS
ncbi:MAG: hypothetical protein QG656_2085 [Candidatus Hydrogenedentes bacterium]|nr:hypothetical protein [Candidatus Hydrogenedentota bacterium]